MRGLHNYNVFPKWPAKPFGLIRPALKSFFSFFFWGGDEEKTSKYNFNTIDQNLKNIANLHAQPFTIIIFFLFKV